MNLRLPAAVVGLCLVVVTGAACSGKDDPVAVDTTTSTVPSTTTTTAPPPVSPLTGLPTADPGAEAHAAVTVKMDNSPEARPQSGLNDADVVYELKVEGITRYALVFHSSIADGIGPVRSARSSDIDLVADLSRPLFVWSGGNQGVTRQVLDAARDGILTNASFDAAEQYYYRTRDRKAPHNLYVNLGPLVAERNPEGQGAPAPIFQYRVSGAEPTGAGLYPVAGVSVDYGLKNIVQYVWDAERQGWDRFQVDSLHRRPDAATVDGAGVQVAPPNVVILFTPYGVSVADSRSPQALTVGEGEALVLTGGAAIPGRWIRPSADVPAQLFDTAGQPILLAPGRTWVALPEVGSPVVPLDQPTADGFLAERR